MRRGGKSGFTLVELLIALGIIGIILSAVTTFFLGVLRQSRVQARLTASNVEGVMGLQLLRKDLSMAGYGLPWDGLVAYNEAASGRLNDASAAPRLVASANSPAYAPNGSDYLVVKSLALPLEEAPRKWTRVSLGGVTRTWGDNAADFTASNRVIVINPGGTGAARSLVTSGGTFSRTFAQVQAGDLNPSVAGAFHLVYGVSDGTDLRMPFNRADYFISPLEAPQRCAPGTGVLVKGVVSQADGTLSPVIPLLDCVQDMQVSYRYSTNPADPVGTLTDDIAVVGATAGQIRANLREVRVSILAHEGAVDPSYTHPTSTIYVGDPGLGRADNVASMRNYRWKTYSISVRPSNLGN
jgi:prepilin-type N-terminal cleavage/methylation domain-containing protein